MFAPLNPVVQLEMYPVLTLGAIVSMLMSLLYHSDPVVQGLAKLRIALFPAKSFMVHPLKRSDDVLK